MFGTGFRENLLYHPALDSSPLTGFNFKRALSLLTAPLHAQTASSHFSWIICPFFYFLHTSFSHLSFVRNSSLIQGAFCPSWRKAPQLCFVIIMLLLITSLFACQTSPPLPHLIVLSLPFTVISSLKLSSRSWSVFLLRYFCLTSLNISHHSL